MALFLLFLKIKTSQICAITLSFTDIGKSCTSCGFLMSANMSFNAIHEKKFMSNISKFAVGFLFINSEIIFTSKTLPLIIIENLGKNTSV